MIPPALFVVVFVFFRISVKAFLRQLREKLLAALRTEGVLVKVHLVRIDLNRGAAMGAFVLDHAFKDLIFVVLRQFLVLVVIEIGLQIGQILVDALDVVAQFPVGRGKRLKGFPDLVLST